MNRKVRYEEMLPHEIVQARTECPVVYVPQGGVEWHGEQNCVGLDTVKAHALAMKCAEAHGGLVMPALFFGEPRTSGLMEANYDPDGRILEKMGLPRENFTPGYMYTQPLEEHERYVRLLLHVLFQMVSLGFRVIVLVTGHAPLINHAKAAIQLFDLQIWSQTPGKAKAWSFIGYDLVQDVMPEPEAGDHAAAWETSLMMALRPDLVDLDRLPADDRPESLIGIWGRDPRKFASKEFGQRGVDIIVARVGEKVKGLLA